MRTFVLLLLLSGAAAAQPADCVVAPTPPDQRMGLDVAIPLAGLPGVPKAAGGGYVGLGLRDVPANGTICGTAEPALPLDVLRGTPSGDLLLGLPPRGEVQVEIKAKE